MLKILFILILVLGLAGIVYFGLFSKDKNKGTYTKLSVVLLLVGSLANVANTAWFNAEANKQYHVTTFMGTEKVVKTPGPAFHWWGNIVTWKKAVSIQADGDGVGASANLPSQDIIFLDQVTADATATARFRIPTDDELFLKMSREYRSEENLLYTLLIPHFTETLKANSQIMSADEYYSGGMTKYNSSFEEQLSEGVIQVNRIDKEVIDVNSQRKCEADARKAPDMQLKCDDFVKKVFEVVPVLDEDGDIIRKSPKYKDFGISVVSANVTGIIPNHEYQVRMKEKQDAAAKRATNREKRISMEEQEGLAVAEGLALLAKEEAERNLEQKKLTMNAETQKKLSAINAEKLEQSAIIEKRTAQTLLDKAKIDAAAIKVTADAEAYARKKKIDADDGFKQRVELEKYRIDKIATAISQMDVPVNMVVNGSDSSNGGGDPAMNTIMQFKMIEFMEQNADKKLQLKKTR